MGDKKGKKIKAKEDRQKKSTDAKEDKEKQARKQAAPPNPGGKK
ncbi:hypothetical protein ACFLX5_04195 [Chloroflexota bacterium]